MIFLTFFVILKIKNKLMNTDGNTSVSVRMLSNKKQLIFY